MPNEFESPISASKIACERVKRPAAVLLALLLTGFVVATPAQEQHKKPTHSGSVDLPFEPVAPQEAAAATATVTHDFTTSDLSADIHNTTEIKIPGTGTSGIASAYPLSTVISGFQGRVGRLAVRLNNLTHTCPRDLVVLLVGPQGQTVVLMSAAGGCTPVDEVYLTLQDGSPKLLAYELTSGAFAPSTYLTHQAPPPAPGKPYLTSLSSFAATDPNGTWRLFVYDRQQDDVGMLSGFTLMISPQLSNNTPLSIPDSPGAAVESLINVSGLAGIVTKVTVSFHITHPWDADLDVALVGPDNTTARLVEDRGGIAAHNFGTSCANRTVLDDDATTAIGAGVAPFVGTYRPETSLGTFFNSTPNGTWKLRIRDDAAADVGTLQCWSITLTVRDFGTVQAPTRLRVASIAGNEVTLRWTSPYDGAWTNYVLEGGLSPGETLASIATNSVRPIYTFVAPTGSFYVRLRAQSGNQLGPPSNEIPLHVNVPLPPSPPALLQGVADGSTIALAWRNTFDGGAPTSLILDVSGDANASIPLPLTESITFAGVPAGTYDVRLRAVNGAGVSGPALNARYGAGPSENPLTLTFPEACSGAPSPPSSFLAYRTGNTINVVWDPPADGWAPTEYVLNVDDAFVGSFTTTARALRGAVGPGTYLLSVAARNPCGVSPATAVQHVIVP